MQKYKSYDVPDDGFVYIKETDHLAEITRLQSRAISARAEANKNMIELCEARARIQVLENPELMIEEAHYQNGKLDIRASHPVFVIFIEECSRIFEETAGVNFVCIEGIDKKDRSLVITIQLEGGKTPAARLGELEAEIARMKKENDILLDAAKAAYRKHHLDDSNIGWDELSGILLNALCDVMGDKGYQDWLKSGI